ncbi:MAG TPA: hypothetical protein VLU96_11475 [Gaiellaceae bacterium]|nr:hypothetical protein [Gaiellaceae bacterium]
MHEPVTGRSALVLLALALALTGGLAASGAARPPGPGQSTESHLLPGFAALLKRDPPEHRRPGLQAVSLTDETWVCAGPVGLASVTVTMTRAHPSRRGGDAVHLERGCTGRIGRLVVRTWVADGVKIADGVHDLTVRGGSIRCLGKLPAVHQDGVQVMGGARITLERLRIDCGRAGERLINSNLFIKESGRSRAPPTDVVCVRCRLGGSAAHTVSIQRSVRSGVEHSTLCAGKFPRLTLDVGPDAVDPVIARDSVGAC